MKIYIIKMNYYIVYSCTLYSLGMYALTYNVKYMYIRYCLIIIIELKKTKIHAFHVHTITILTF